MAIRIIDEPEIVLTRAEYERLRRGWAATQTMTVAPSSFECWLAQRMANEHQAKVMSESYGQGATHNGFVRLFGEDWL